MKEKPLWKILPLSSKTFARRCDKIIFPPGGNGLLPPNDKDDVGKKLGFKVIGYIARAANTLIGVLKRRRKTKKPTTVELQADLQDLYKEQEKRLADIRESDRSPAEKARLESDAWELFHAQLSDLNIPSIGQGKEKER